MAERKKAAEVPAAEPAELSPAETRRREKRGFIFVIVVSLAIVLILVGTFAYLRWDRERTEAENAYNGFDFAEQPYGGVMFWTTTISNRGALYPVLFFHHPREAESVMLESGITDRFVRPELRPAEAFLAFDPESDPVVLKAGIEISKVLGGQYGLFNVPTRGALKRATSNESETPVIECSMATRDRAVLSFDLGADNAVYRDRANPFCIHVEYASENESTLVADRFAFGLLRIMPG